MAYVRNYRRRYPRRTNRARKVTGTTRSIAVKALKTARYVKKVAKPEILYRSLVAAITPGTTGSFIALNPLSQGDGVGERTGDLCRMTSFKHTFQFTMNSAAFVDVVRCIIFVEKLPIVVGTAPVITTLLLANDPTALVSPVTGNRYKILSDRVYPLSIASNPVRVIKSTTKLDVVTKWSDGTDVNIEKNALWMYFICTENTNKTQVIHKSLTRYSDV